MAQQRERRTGLRALHAGPTLQVRDCCCSRDRENGDGDCLCREIRSAEK